MRTRAYTAHVITVGRETVVGRDGFHFFDRIGDIGNQILSVYRFRNGPVIYVGYNKAAIAQVPGVFFGVFVPAYYPAAAVYQNQYGRGFACFRGKEQIERLFLVLPVRDVFYFELGAHTRISNQECNQDRSLFYTQFHILFILF